MITLHVAKDLVGKHKNIAESRHKLWGDLHSMAVCDMWAVNGEEGDQWGTQESVEDGSMFGAFDTKVAATTPLHPRIEVTAPTLEVEPADEEEAAMVEEENDRRTQFAAARSRYIHHIWDVGRVRRTWLRLNNTARVVSHCWLKAEWSARLQRPMVRVFTPLVVWCDESVDDIADMAYIIHATFPRRHEVLARVKAGLYAQNIDRELTFGPRPDWSRLSRGQNSADTVLDCAVIYEVHDLIGKKVYHYAESHAQGWLMESEPSYLFMDHPFHYVSFHEYMDGQRGLSDAEILRGPAQRLSRLANIEYFAGRSQVPQTLFNSAAAQDAKAAEEEWARPRAPGDSLNVPLRSGQTVADLVQTTPVPNVNLALGGPKETAFADFSQRAAIPAYQRGEAEPRVAATFGALQQQAEATRRGMDIAELQTALIWWAETIVALAEEFMPEHVVVQIQERDPTGRPTAQTSTVHRASMDFRDPAEWAWAKSIGADPPDARQYFYSMEVYEDPMTKNPQAKQALYMQLLTAAATGAVPLDPMYIAEKLRLALGEGPALVNRDWTPPTAAPPGGAAAGAAPPVDPNADPMSAGGMPPGLEPVPTPALPAMAGGAGAPAPVPPGLGTSTPT